MTKKQAIEYIINNSFDIIPEKKLSQGMGYYNFRLEHKKFYFSANQFKEGLIVHYNSDKKIEFTVKDDRFELCQNYGYTPSHYFKFNIKRLDIMVEYITNSIETRQYVKVMILPYYDGFIEDKRGE